MSQLQKKAERKKSNKLSFLEHLSVLKKYFLVYITVLIFISVFTYNYHQVFLDYIINIADIDLVFLSPLDPILFIMKAVLYMSFIISFPVLVYLVVRFVSPTLRKGQLMKLNMAIMVSFGLCLGALFYVFKVVLPMILNFLLSIKVLDIQMMITAQNYFNFIIFFTVVNILIFQIPFIIILLSYLKLFNPKIISGKRNYVYLSLVVFFAVLTPTTDIVSLLVVLLPTVILLEVSVFLGNVIYSRH